MFSNALGTTRQKEFHHKSAKQKQFPHQHTKGFKEGPNLLVSEQMESGQIQDLHLNWNFCTLCVCV